MTDGEKLQKCIDTLQDLAVRLEHEKVDAIAHAVADATEAANAQAKEKKREPRIRESCAFPREYFICDGGTSRDWLTSAGEWISSSPSGDELKASGCYFASREIAEDVTEAWCKPIPRYIDIYHVESGYTVCDQRTFYKWLWRDGEWCNYWSIDAQSCTFATKELAEQGYRTWIANQHVKAEVSFVPLERRREDGKDRRRVTEQPRVREHCGKPVVTRGVGTMLEFMDPNGSWCSAPYYYVSTVSAQDLLATYWRSIDRPEVPA